MSDDRPSSTQLRTAPQRVPGSDVRTLGPRASSGNPGAPTGPATAIPRRPRVTWWLGAILSGVFAVLVLPSLTADRFLGHAVEANEPSALTVRVAPFGGDAHLTGGGILIARGQVPTQLEAAAANRLLADRPAGGLPYLLYGLLALALALIATHHLRRSIRGRLVRVQLVGFAAIAVLALVVKVVLLATTVSILAVPVAAFALVPTLTLDRIVGLATGVLAALVVALVGPFDVGVAILLLVQVSVAGLVVAEGPKRRVRHAVYAGACATLATALIYPLYLYLGLGHAPLAELSDPLHSPWVAAALGPALGTLIAVAGAPLYQLLVGEITQHQLIELEDLSNPLLKQIAERSPGTWQHSLMMANLAEIAANEIGASGRLVRVGAYYHDLGKSLQPKYFIENLEPGETSPHDQLPPEVSCDAIFAHVTGGIVAARKAGLHERIIDFMHMHHGDGVLEYFWARCQEQGNPHGLTVENFRYPGHPPQSRETAILAICDAVEAASRTLKKADPVAIDSLVQRIVYGKLHLGQLDESGLSMGDLRRIADSLRETIRHANHGRIEYPWQKADAAQAEQSQKLATAPRLDSLDGVGLGARDRTQETDAGLAVTAPQKPPVVEPPPAGESQRLNDPNALLETAPQKPPAAVPTTRTGMAVRKIEEKVTQPFDRKSSGGLRAKAEGPTQPFERKKTGGLVAITSEQAAEHAAAAEIAAMNAAPEHLADAPSRGVRSVGPEPVRDAPSRGIRVPEPLVEGTRSAKREARRTGVEQTLEDEMRIGVEQVTREQVMEQSASVPVAEQWIEHSTRATATAPSPAGSDSAVIELPQAARKRAATLPPGPSRRAPTVPPPGRRTGSFPTIEQVLAPTVAAPRDLDPGHSARSTADAMDVPFAPAEVTDHGIPGVFTEVTRPGIAAPPPDWAKRLAARIDAEIETDFGGETKQQSLGEIERLRRRIDPTHELSSSDLLALAGPSRPPPRRAQATHEVDPDDIEAAIEVAPPARRPATAIGIAKKKPEP